MQDGTAVEFITGFREMASKTKQFEVFSPEEIDGMVTGMYKTLSEEQGFEDKQVARAAAEKKQLRDDVVEAFDEAWITGTLDVAMVDGALEANVFDEADHKKYSEKVWDKGAKFTNTKVELNLVHNLASSSVQDIMGIEQMTNEDKMKYIKQLRTYQASDEGKWTSTVQGRASLNILKNKFNVDQASILAQLTKKEDLEAYNQAYSSFIIEMEKLPAGVREHRAISYSQASIDVQMARQLDSEKNAASSVIQASNNKKKVAIQQRVMSYQRQVGKQKSIAYMNAIAAYKETFGEIQSIKFKLNKEYR